MYDLNISISGSLLTSDLCGVSKAMWSKVLVISFVSTVISVQYAMDVIPLAPDVISNFGEHCL